MAAAAGRWRRVEGVLLRQRWCTQATPGRQGPGTPLRHLEVLQALDNAVVWQAQQRELAAWGRVSVNRHRAEVGFEARGSLAGCRGAI